MAALVAPNPSVVDEAASKDVQISEKLPQPQKQDNSLVSEDASSYPLSSADGRLKKPFARPLDTVSPPSRPSLTDEQQKKYGELLKAATAWKEVPESAAQGATKSPITDSERMFLTRECLLRYLRATKWVRPEAEKRLMGTLVWRREYGIEKRTADMIGIENETGKQIITGYDIHARPCHYLRPSKQNTERSDRQIQHLVFMLERVIDLMVPGQETLALLISFAETRTGQGASVAQGRQTLYILQNHYPERLGRALVTNVPFMIWGFFKLITPFIDPLTREKLKFNEEMAQHVPTAQLLKENGGEVDFEYDHSVYWPALNSLADARRAAYRKRWEDAGKHVGESEDYLRGGNSTSLFQPVAEDGVQDSSL